ncbi:MAG: pyridoxal-phosphate dependent enzyme [Bacteroidia bacterium]|nr:MAG: pyridoxal-phosphate dependent enzyme [Bacteroidia bacterium]
MGLQTKKVDYAFECIDCGKQQDAHNQVIYLCPDCSSDNTPDRPPRGVLKTVYDYSLLRNKNTSLSDLSLNGFLDLLPIERKESLPPLRIGNTPMYVFRELDGRPLPYFLHVKDDGQNPTFSYKDRASALVSAYAAERGINTIVAASTGNAGSSIAGICASRGQHAVVLVPETAPKAKISQVMMYGAHLIPVRGSYDEAFELSIRLSNTYGWYNRNTAYNPLTIEGKKTAAWEIFTDMAATAIDRIFISVGDGVIISGIYRGFEDLLKIGLLEKMPVLVAVQSEESDNLVRNMAGGHFTIKTSTTMADSISVDVPRNFRMAKQLLRQYGGEWVTVRDADILSAASVMARNTGIFSEPAAAAAFAGLLKYHREARLDAGTHNIVMSTGSGLKDLRAVEKMIRLPDAVDPGLTSLSDIRDLPPGL